MDYQEFYLDNGIRVITLPDYHTPVVHMGLFIGVGSRDEQPEDWGMAHFLEHVLFKGTTKRKAFHILSRLDAVGGELNAYTTKEETVVYASFLKDYLSRSAELISDVVFNSTFPENEIVKEKAVVIDEINSYKDNPSEMVFEEFDQMVFGNHSLGREILGDENQVNGFTREGIQRFVDQNYIPENTVISCVGHFNAAHLKRVLNKYFQIPRKNILGPVRVAPENVPIQQVVKDKVVFQNHTMIGGRAVGMHSEEKTAMILLNNILGGPALNARLNISIRERHGIAYNIESNYHAYSDCGIWSIYFGTDPKNQKRAERLVLKELKKLREEPLSDQQLNMAKQQIKGQIAMGMESNLGRMLALGKSALNYETIDSTQESFDKIDAVTSAEIQKLAHVYFDEQALFKLTYQPKD